MDSQSKDFFKQILERLDKMDSQLHKLNSQQHQLDSQQHKLDRVMGRLDTLQNILERQNQKQNLLDENLVEMTIKRQQEKAVMVEQLHEAPFRASGGQGVSALSPHKTAQTLQSLDCQICDKLKLIADRTVLAAQKCHQLTSWSHKMEDKMTELASNNVKMETFLLEMRSLKDLIKGQTNSELIWLNNKMDKKLSDIVSVVRENYQQQTEAKEETVRSTAQLVNTDIERGQLPEDNNEPLRDKQLLKELCDKQMQVILNLVRKIEQHNSSVLEVSKDVKGSLYTIFTTNIDTITELGNRISNSIERMNESSKEQSHLLNETLKSDLNKHFVAVQSELQTNRETVISESETQTCRIISAAETVKEDVRRLIQTEEDNSSKHEVEIGSIHCLINCILNKMQENLDTTLKKVDSTEASTIIKYQTVNTKLEELNTDLINYIHKTKREIFAVTEKEAQIVRDRIQGPLPSQGKYTFDFYVNNFRTLVRSGKDVDSLPWHINELQTCVACNVTMLTNGEMKIWLVHGRHPREVGLQPRSGKRFKFKAIICDIDNKKLPPVDVGEGNFPLNEPGITWNGGYGCEVGVISCDVLLEIGYGVHEGYDQGALLIRFEVTVL